ncbi:MAG: FAD-binding protein, partial [Methanobrevibacter sp.]|nr:FAD-binding protein [Methanobrevibacter sp.]
LEDNVIEEKLETMLLQFLDVGIDIRKIPMEVAPTAHHFMGGIKIDKTGSTSIKNLYGAGEVVGGVHGANRLGGNALADTQVFGRITGLNASKMAKKTDFEINIKNIEKEEERINSLIKNGEFSPVEIKKELKNTMWKYVAIIRNEEGLKTALDKVYSLKNKLTAMKISNEKHFNKSLQEGLEVINMIEIAIIIIKSAILRRESRGAHFREDYPETLKEWEKSIVINKNKVRFIQR